MQSKLNLDFDWLQFCKDHDNDLYTYPKESMQIKSLTLDSRNVQEGSCYIAHNFNSKSLVETKEFIPAASQSGASVFITENASDDLIQKYPVISCKSINSFLTELLAKASDHAQADLSLIGVTGTNGKTSVAWILKEALNILGAASGSSGTLGVLPEKLNISTKLTTADLLTNYEALVAARAAKLKNMIFEVSSHALAQQRLLGIDFSYKIYTNLSRDHLDFHQHMDEYFQVKAGFFADDLQASCSVVNIDCPYGKQIAKRYAGQKIYTYGHDSAASLRIIKSEQGTQSAQYYYIGRQGEFNFQSRLLGDFQAYNLAAAIIVLEELGYSTAEIAKALSEVKPVPGRLEPALVEGKQIFIDYAHTPDALEKALQSIRSVSKGRLWVVFGCGGDRDRGKRAEMGRIAEQNADCVVVTSDNPRTENPQQIINDILTGCQPEIVEVDRKLAIEKTLNSAAYGDMVLIAGKGHEDYQEINNVRYEFSDQAVVNDYLKNK